MSWNNGYERKRFEEEQEIQAEEYRRLGMSEDQIREMYLFDLEWFKSRRRYYSHTQLIPSGVFGDGYEENCESTLYGMLSAALLDAINRPANCSRYFWVEDIEDPPLVQKLRSLDKNDLDLLTLFAFDGYTLTEIGRIYRCTPQNIFKKYRRIKNNLV